MRPNLQPKIKINIGKFHFFINSTHFPCPVKKKKLQKCITIKVTYLLKLLSITRFKEFNGEKKTATKTSNMFKIVPRIGTCNAGFSSSKFRSSCIKLHPS
jgi:hypothetical protein